MDVTTPFSRDFHVLVDVALCLLNTSKFTKCVSFENIVEESGQMVVSSIILSVLYVKTLKV